MVSKPTEEKEPEAEQLLCPLVELTIDFLLSVINAVLTTKHAPRLAPVQAHIHRCKMFFEEAARVGGRRGGTSQTLTCQKNEHLAIQELHSNNTCDFNNENYNARRCDITI